MRKAVWILLLVVVCSPVYALTGKDLVCNDIGYLSTGCQTAEVVPMEVYDKEIALAKANHPEQQGDTTNITVVVPQPKQPASQERGINVTATFEQE